MNIAGLSAILALFAAAPATAAAPPQVFLTGGDRVHRSSTGPPTMSAHGWWVLVEGTATHARVTIRIQQKKGSGWVRVGKRGRKIVKPGGGSSRRATARARCHEYKGRLYRYRSVVDVDLIGFKDTPEKLTTSVVTSRCSYLGRDP